MCSHESITWKITDNSVANRMFDNSLMHKFRSARKIRRRTKMLNAMIKNCSVRDYKHYIALKKNIVRNLVNNTDTDDSSSLTDVDYDIIYNSPSKRAKYVNKNLQNYILTSEDEIYERKTITRKKKSKIKSTERTQTRKSPRVNTAVPEKCINTDRQEVIEKSSSVSHKRSYTNVSNNKGNILKNNDHLKIQSNKQSLSPRFDSQNSTSFSIMKSGNKYMRQHHKDFDAIDNELVNELSSKDNMISNKTKSVSEKKVQNKENQSITINESNTDFDSQGSHYQPYLSRLTSLENNNDNEVNSLVKSNYNNSNKSTAVSNKNSVNAKNENTYCKPELLENVKRNLIVELESINSADNNQDIKTDKTVEELSYEQLLPDIANFNRHSTPLKKTQTNVPEKNLSPDASQDQQKDSGIDEDSQDRFVKIKKSNKNPTSRNMEKNAEEILIFSPQLNKIDEVLETMEDCKEIIKDSHLNFNIDVLGEQINEEEKVVSEEEIKSFPKLNQINVDMETNQKDEHFISKIENLNDIQKQQLPSPKQDCMKEAYSKLCNLMQEEEDDRTLKKSTEEEISLQLSKENNAFNRKDISFSSSADFSINYEGKQDSSKEKKKSFGEEIKNFLQLNQIDNGIEIYSTNHEDQTHFVKSEDSHTIQKQELLSPKENHIKDVHPKSCSNILSENNRRINEEKEENFLQLNQINKDTNMHLINQEHKTCMKQDIHNIQKQQTLLPKIMCTEILNKKYKVIDKKDIDIDIEKIDTNDINNMDIDNEYTSIKNNTLENYSNMIDHDNWQEAVINEEIDTPMTLETDNEKDNVNCMSPQTKKFQQQARLNLVVNSDSSESDDEYAIAKTSRKHIDSSNMNHCNENDRLNNDETNCTSKQIEIDVSRSEDTCKLKTTTSILVDEVKLNSTIANKDIKKTKSLISCTYENNDLLQSASNKNDHNINNWQEAVVNEKKINTSTALETNNEENNVNCMSPQTEKRFQLQARLNLVVNSDSSESDDEYAIAKTSRKHIDSSNMNHCNENDRLNNDETNCTSKQIEIDVSRNEDTCKLKTTTSILVDEVKLNSTITKENIKETKSLISCTYENNDLLQSASNKNDHNTNNWQEVVVNEKKINTSTALETNNEENNVNCMSPQTEKRFQLQARLNLVVNSDSSESDDEYAIAKTSQKHEIDNSDISHCSEDDSLNNDEINCTSKQIETDVLRSEDICKLKNTTPILVDKVKLNSTITNKDIKKTKSLNCTYKNNDLLQSATNKDPLQETQSSENVYNDDRSQEESLTESFQLQVSDNNVSCNNKEFINQVQRHQQPLLNKKNIYIKNNQNEKIISAELETRHESEHEQSTQTSIKYSNAPLNIFCQYRPCNIQQLVEDQELLVETIPASFTLADLSEDEEAFILNIPSKIVQNNLQNQLLTLKEKSIKFNENKYRTVRKKVGTTSCIFATGKKRKPYKIINIKNISTITIREKIPQDSEKSNVLNFDNTISSVRKAINKNQ